MVKDNKISMPSSGAGLTRFSDDMKSKVQIKPQHVIIIIVISILLVFLLKQFGTKWLGLE